MATKWDKEVKQYVDFRSDPANVRASIAEWAKNTIPHVPLPTVYGWTKSPDIMKDITTRFDKLYRNYETPIVQAVIESAKQGNPQAQKLYFQYVQRWSEKTLVEHSGDLSVNADAVAKLVEEKLKNVPKGK